MKLTTNTTKSFTGYLLKVTVHVEDKLAKCEGTSQTLDVMQDSIRLRDTAAHLIAAADLLDSLK